MSSIIELRALRHAELPGINVFPLGEAPQKGQPQDVLVAVPPNGVIPLHTHGVDACMFIVAGSAVVLSGDPRLEGKHVGLGSCVRFEKEVPHGFRAGPDGLSFVSRNGGIVDAIAPWDVQMVG